MVGFDFGQPCSVGLLMETAARLNHGRWLIDCPNCASATYCEPRNQFAIVWGEPFNCVECGIKDVPVRYPAQGMRNQIEVAVRSRPEKHQNWESGETVAFLLRENAERGI